jgi:O-antigen/teichoic acid export membrane protein
VSTSTATEAPVVSTSNSTPHFTRRDETIGRAWILLGGLTFVTTVAAFTRNKLAAVTLGPAGLGIYAQATTFLLFATTLCTMGMGQGIVKLLAERDDKPLDGIARNDIIRSALLLQLSLGLFAAFGVSIFARPLAQVLFSDSNARSYVIILGTAIPFLLLFSNLGYFLQGYRSVKDYTFASGLNAVIGLVVFLALLWWFRLNGAVASLLVGAVLSVFVFWWFFRKQATDDSVTRGFDFPRGNFSVISTILLKYGTVVFIGGVLDTLSMLVLRTWIVNSQGAIENGIYQAVVGVSGQYIGFFTLLNNAYLYPKLSSLRSSGERSAEINHAVCVGLTLAVPLLAGIIIFRRQLVVLLFARSFLPAANIMMWQAFGDFFKITAWFVSASLLPTGRLRAYVTLTIAYTAFFLPLAFAFLLRWQLRGLVIAYCLSFAVYLIAVTIVQIRLLGLSFLPYTIRIFLSSTGVLICALWLPNVSAFDYVLKLTLLVVWLMIIISRDNPILDSVRRRLRRT